MKNLVKKFFKFLGIKGTSILVICLLMMILALQNLAQAFTFSFLFWDIAAVSVFEIMLGSMTTGIVAGFVLKSLLSTSKIAR